MWIVVVEEGQGQRHTLSGIEWMDGLHGVMLPIGDPDIVKRGVIYT